MGGYFVPYVLGAVALVWWSARSVPAAKWPAALVIALSLICASMPMSHELRYYMFWMLTLVSCVLVIVYSPIFANPQQALQRKFTNGVVAIALASVIMMTGAAYLRVRATTLHDLLVQTDATVAQIPDGGALCILNMHPYGFLYASVFHPPRRYHTKSLRAGEQADCTIRLDLDKQR
jgi:predicted membrane metal-binding protein